MKFILTSLICALLLFTKPLSAQTKGFVIPDSLKGKTYEELNNRYVNHLNVPIQAHYYAQIILEKGKIKKDIEMMANAYLKLGFVAGNDTIKLNYYHQSIDLSRNQKITDFPIKPYILLGKYYSDKFQFKTASQYYLAALEVAQKENNVELEYYLMRLIGFIKYNLNDYKEAQSIFKKCDVYYEQNLNDSNAELYFNNLIALSNVYIRSQKLDSARYIVHKGIEKARVWKKEELIPAFTFNDCIIDFTQKKYQSIIDHYPALIQYYTSIEDKANISNIYYYVGSSYYQMQHREKGIIFLLKMDSIYQKSPYFLYDERKGYDLLIQYYKEEKNLHKQLDFIQKTIKIDSMQYLYDKSLRTELQLKYDNPILLKEKEQIIHQLQGQSKKQHLGIILAVMTLVALTLYLGIQYKKNQSNKKKYQDLMLLMEKSELQKKEAGKLDLKPVSKDLKTVIAHRLKQFEIQKKYRNKDITLHTLAKEINTNSAYLSKYFNQELKLSFSMYLTELRIQDAIETLKNETKIRNYTIKAISEIFGFNNPETFSKAFYNKIGIYPSFFIKKLKQENLV
jgi:AraC-like DNA-binding protein